MKNKRMLVWLALLSVSALALAGCAIGVEQEVEAPPAEGEAVEEEAAPADEPELSITQLPKDELARMIRELKRQMEAAAENLQFEKAALLRDEIYELRAVLTETEAADVPAWERERRLARLGIE